MARYVDVDKVRIPKGFFDDLNVPKLLDWLNSHPTADVVEVVRCKDCVYWECRGYDGRCEAYKNGLVREYTNYDDYCSYGERKCEE